MPLPVASPSVVHAWQDLRAGGRPSRTLTGPAVRELLHLLAARAPGHSVEVRVPPYGAVQAIPGVRHRRGTPPAVVEMAPETWLSVAMGVSTWFAEVDRGRIRASGERSDLSEHLPVVRLPGGDPS